MRHIAWLDGVNARALQPARRFHLALEGHLRREIADKLEVSATTLRTICRTLADYGIAVPSVTG